MERLESAIFDADKLLQLEHQHRYIWASRYAYGDVCDIACGNGYGGEIITSSQSVRSYVGIDTAPTAVAEANFKLSANSRRYMLGSALDIPLNDCSIDTIISLETLEHIEEPSHALAEFKRILRPDGILVGSVPSEYFDDRAEEVYGENPYHLTRFSHGNLSGLLGRCFCNFRIYFSSLEVVSHIGALTDGHPSQTETLVAQRAHSDDEVGGSFHFVATNRQTFDIDQRHESQIVFCVGLTDFEASHVQLLRAKDQLILAKDLYIKELEEIVRLRNMELTVVDKAIRWIRTVF